VGEGIARYLGKFLEESRGGSAGFYYYLTFRDIETGTGSAFFRYLMRITGDEAVDGPPGARRPNVVYIPGVYCVHPEGDLAEKGKRQLRLSYGFEDSAKILPALAMMRDAAEYALSVAQPTVVSVRGTER
jgi:hypothetical protein